MPLSSAPSCSTRSVLARFQRLGSASWGPVCRIRPANSVGVSGGSGLLELLDVLKEPTVSTGLGPLLVGAAVSFIVGVISLRWLLRWLNEGQLHRFAWWLFLLGPAVIAWQLWSVVSG